LEEIVDEKDLIIVDGNERHKSCSEEFDSMVEELEKIYDNTCPKDI